MKRKIFYFVISLLTIIDSFLLSKPNLLGKVGLIIYKYHYLRTFPRTLLTVSIVVIIALALTNVIHFLVAGKNIKRFTGTVFLLMLIVISVAVLIKTGMDFSAWSYSHTGHKFKYGAYLSPSILVVIFVHELIMLPKIDTPLPDMPLSNVEDINKRSDADSRS